MKDSNSAKRRLVWGMILVLGIIHYDFWFWTDRRLLFGFLPIGLGFHVLFSLLAGLCWFLVVRFAWPSWIEEWASQGSDADAGDPH
jgi:hypothetical protein